MLLLPRLPGHLRQRPGLPADDRPPQAPRRAAFGDPQPTRSAVGDRIARGQGLMSPLSLHPHPSLPRKRGRVGEGVSRRQVLTIVGAVAGLPLLPSADQPGNAARLYRWQGTSLGSPSYILLHHPDRVTAERAVAGCVAEIERLE